MRPELRRLLRSLGAAAALCLLLLLSALPKSATVIYTWPWAFYGQMLLLVPFWLLACTLSRRESRWKRQWCVCAAPTIATLISAAVSRRPAFSFEVALMICSMLALSAYVAARVSRELMADSENRRLVRAARFVGFLILVPLGAGLALWFKELAAASTHYVSTGDWISQIPLYRNMHPFGHWNYVGGFALLALASFVALALLENRRWRVTWIVAAGFALLTLASSGSRGAILGLCVALASGLTAALMTKSLKRRTAITAMVVASLAIGAIVASVPRLREFVAKPTLVFTPNEGDVQRIAMLQAGRLLFVKSPAVGHGPGITPFVYPEVRAQLAGGVETAYQLHNGPLQLAVDSGILGIVAWLALACEVAVQGYRWLRISPSNDNQRVARTLALASVCGLTGYLVIFVTDYQFDVLPISAIVGLLMGLSLAGPEQAVATSGPAANRALKLRRLAAVTLVVFTIFAIVALAPAWRARHAFWQAWSADESKDDARMLAHLREAAALQPGNPHYLTHVGLRLALDAGKAPTQATAETSRAEARSTLERSLAIEQLQEPAHSALGWLLVASNPQAAREHFLKCVQLIPDRDTLHLGLAFSALNKGDRTAVVHELALECIVNPSLHAWPLWAQEPFRDFHREVMDRVTVFYAAALSHPGATDWQRAHIAYAAAFHRWWLGGAAPSDAELTRATPEQQRAFAAFRNGVLTPRPTTRKYQLPFDALAGAMSNPASSRPLMEALAPRVSAPAIAGALARLNSGLPRLDDIIRAPARNGVGAVQRHIERGHYSIMNRVMDGPGYADLAPRVTDAFFMDFAEFLFPTRGYMPTPILLDLAAPTQ